ncbi:MAG: EF-P beta-lysylation protein EpmB [Cycloclasticus sp.]|nr:MAG: EF-P beta-lysylation protein EpmB [Cycloclasticus sp.]
MTNMMDVEKTSLIPTWQQELQSAFIDIDQLLTYLQLKNSDLTLHRTASKGFPLLVTRSYADRIKKSDWNDPLLLQVLPQPDELQQHPSYLNDPVGDAQASVLPGLIHKYHGRALIITTGACAIHCRYCFRREFPYSDNSANRSQLNSINHYLSQHKEVTEVILSGGDPLTLSDSRFRHLIESLSKNHQIERIRIHSRLPIVLPSRITKGLLNTLNASSKKIILVIHANHANELTNEVADVLFALKQIEVTLLNQTVLLKGINDNANTLIQLSLRLFECHTLPYYLHTLDKVSGAMHFDSGITNTYKIYQQVQTQLPGYLVPKLVSEDAGQPFKTILPTND